MHCEGRGTANQARRARLAVLIDGENASPRHARAVFETADIALVIDAVDLSYRARLDGFALVSSDSDFTRLAQRLREGGFAVYGFGESRTPRAFRNACHSFEIVGKAANGRAAAPEGRAKEGEA